MKLYVILARSCTMFSGCCTCSCQRIWILLVLLFLSLLLSLDFSKKSFLNRNGNWLTWLRRLTIPWFAVDKLYTQESRWCSPSLKDRKLKTQEKLMLHKGRNKTYVPVHGCQAGGNSPLLVGELAFFSIQTFNWLKGVHRHYGGQPALPSLLLHMLISSRNTPTDTIRIMFD